MNAERQAKVSQVKEIFSKISSSKSIVVAAYAGLTVKELQDLRKQLKTNDVEIKVYKNRLFKLAAKEAKLDIDKFLNGPNIYAFGMNDDISPAKILTKFSKDHESLKLKFGTFEGKVVDEVELAKIASLPTLQESYIILARSMITALVNISISLNMLANKKNTSNETTKNKEENSTTSDIDKTQKQDVKVSSNLNANISKKDENKKDVQDNPTSKNTN